MADTTATAGGPGEGDQARVAGHERAQNHADEGAAGHRRAGQPTNALPALGERNTAATVEARVAALTSELARITEERQGSWAVFASLIGVALATAGAFLALGSGDGEPRDWLWAALATIPVLIFAFIVTIFTQGVMQTYYAREIERQLAALLPREGGHLPPALLETVNASLSGNRRGVWEVRVINWAEYSVIALVIGAGAVVAVSNIADLWLRWLMVGTLAALASVIAHLAYRTIAHGADLWWELRSRIQTGLAEPFPRRTAPRQDRRLVSYLLLPRPNDLVVKGLGLHFVSALVGGWLARDQTDWSQVLRYAGVSFVSFELLMYQGRYTFNDWRGQDEDRNSPGRADRRRLPPLDSNIRRRAVWASIGIRAAAALVVVGTLAAPWQWQLLGALVAAWVLAAVYERLRARPGRTQRSERLRGFKMSRWCKEIYAVVGVSYAIRAGLGAFLGSDGLISPVLVGALAITFYFSGMATVLMVWALEATLYIGRRTSNSSREDGQGWELGNHAVTDANRRLLEDLPEANRVSAAIETRDEKGNLRSTKDHLLPLAVAADVLDPNAAVLAESIPDDAQLYRHERVLTRPSPAGRRAQLVRPWNTVFVVACAAAGVAGWLGHDGLGRPALAPCVATALAGLAIGLVCTYRPDQVAGAVVAGSGCWAALLWATGQGFDKLFGIIPITVVVATYSVTLAQTYEDAIGITDKLALVPGQLVEGASRVAKDLLR